MGGEKWGRREERKEGRPSMRMGAGFRIIGEPKEEKKEEEACSEVNEERFLKLSPEWSFRCILKA